MADCFGLVSTVHSDVRLNWHVLLHGYCRSGTTTHLHVCVAKQRMAIEEDGLFPDALGPFLRVSRPSNGDDTALLPGSYGVRVPRLFDPWADAEGESWTFDAQGRENEVLARVYKATTVVERPGRRTGFTVEDFKAPARRFFSVLPYVRATECP